MALEFVEDWTIAQTLGEGAYGEVKLLVNKVNNEAVAMKIIDVGGSQVAKEAVKKEVAIHKGLQHANIIRYFGRRQSGPVEYIFLEYAPHGELFDRIEPDIGMNQWEAQKYLKQLMLGIQYLHSRGVAHRDLKPENLLLDANDNIKISDFGMATVFRVAGKERALDKRCGTVPYVAPEVLCRPYAAEPADIWSCGIVLVAMLAGELPWDEASSRNTEYVSWIKGRYMGLSPWSKLDTLALALLRRILCPLPSARYSVHAVLKHRWTNTVFSPKEHPIHLQHVRNKGGLDEDARCLSQPVEPSTSSPNSLVASRKRKRKRDDGEDVSRTSFSQPTMIQDLLISTQQIFTQSPSTQNSLQKLVRRMTRFFVGSSLEDAFEELLAVLTKLKLTYKTSHQAPVTITTVDRRRNMLVFKANTLEMENKTLVDFRLSKGCGIEFKRHFISIRAAMERSIVSPPPIKL